MEDRCLWRQKRSDDRGENRQRFVSVRVSEHLVEPQGAKNGVMLVLYGVYMIWRLGQVLYYCSDRRTAERGTCGRRLRPNHEL